MLRNITEKDFDEILRWRNSPEVRQVMFTDHEITEKEHLVWWERTKVDSTKKQLLFLWKGENAGVVNLFDIDRNKKECHWGFYLSSDIKDPLLRMQIWHQLEKEVIEYVFKRLELYRLICESFVFNKPVIEMHKRFGFIEVGKEIRVKEGKSEEVLVTDLTYDQYIEHIGDSVKASKEKEFSRLSASFALMGSSNLDFLSSTLCEEAAKYCINFDSADLPFGQYMMLANDPESTVRKNDYDYYIFMERIEDFVNVYDALTERSIEVVLKRWADYLDFIRNSRAQLSGVFLISNVASTSDWLTSLEPNEVENVGIKDAIFKMDQQLEELCAELSDAYIIDVARLVNNMGRKLAHAGKYWYMARAPFSAEFNVYLSHHLIGMILSIEGRTSRVIAIDLDNTLWSGIVGDDGIEGIIVGGDYPGNIFQSIQSVFKALRERGYALVLCSKNTENIALEVFEKHPDMLLKKGDLTSWRINWLPKPENIKDLADELGLGLESFCFIDDNPVEREEMRLTLPEVFVPELPVDISEWPIYISSLPEISDVGLTDEDRQRANQYKVANQIKHASKDDGTRESFLCTLDMEVKMEPLSIENQQRIIQLIKKTNQFNVTTRRHNETDLKLLLNNGACYAIRLQDRLGSDEIIGVLILVYEGDVARIDSFILSCRVLGRSVEVAVLSWLSKFLKENRILKIMGEVIETDRNSPSISVYSANGFKSIGKNFYEYKLTGQTDIKMPAWITVK